MNNAELFFSAAGSAGAIEIERSLRFNSADSAYLNRTPASAGNRKTWTWAGWVKRSSLTAGDYQTLFCAGDSGSANRTLLRFNYSADDCLISTFNESATWNLYTTAVFRDVSAWYHVVLAVDTTQATAADRVKLYVNGVAQTLSGTQATLDELGNISNNKLHYLGNDTRISTFLYDGYLADVHFVDGQQLDPTSFGEFDDNDVWQPIEYTGSFSGNSFHLDFADNSSVAALGYDAAGSNDWTVNNITANNNGAVYGTGNKWNTSTKTVDTALYDGASTSPYILDIAGLYSANPANFAYSGSIDNMFDGTDSYAYILNDYNNQSVYSFLVDLRDFLPVTSVSVRGYAMNGTSYGYYYSPYKAELLDASKSVISGSTITLATSMSDNTVPVSGTPRYLKIFRSGGSYDRGYIAGFDINGTRMVNAELAQDVDSLLDSPTNGDTADDTGLGGQVPGNYCTLNPLDKGSDVNTVTNGNLEATWSGLNGHSIRGTIAVSTGKWYWEATGFNALSAGIIDISQPIVPSSGSLFPGGSGFGAGNSYGYYASTGSKATNGTVTSYGASYGTTDIVGVALDLDNGTLTFYKNGVSQGTAFTGISGTFAPAFGYQNAGTNNLVTNFGQRAFAYQAPSGFRPLATPFLPTPTIEDGSTAMDVVTYSGNGSTQTISGLGFSPDFAWFKARNQAYSHSLYDVVRGALVRLKTNSTDQEANDSGSLTAFNSDGFTLGGSTSTNANTEPYVAWTWDGGQPDTASTGAVSFDGSGDYLSTNVSSSDFSFGTGDFTVECWVYQTSASSAEDGIFQISTTSGGLAATQTNTITLQANGGNYRAYLNDASRTLSTAVITDQWVHLALVRDSGTTKLYVNGVQDATTVTDTKDYSGTYIAIGGYYSTSYLWNGFISNFRVIKGTALYTSNFTPPSTELTNVTNTKLLCCQSTTSQNIAAVSPNISGVNDGTVWSNYIFKTGTSNLAAVNDPDITKTRSEAFNGLTGSTNEFVSLDGDITFTPPSTITGISQVKVYASGSSTFPNKIYVNGTLQATLTSDTTVTVSTSSFSSVRSERQNTSDSARFSGIEIDGVLLKDPVASAGHSAATTYNPLDAFSVDGTGYSTASAAGLTSGTITPTGASVNRSAGFSIVTFSITSASSSIVTFGTGLGVAPSFVLIKVRNVADSWTVYHDGITSPTDNWLALNSTAAAGGSTLSFSTSSTTFGVRGTRVLASGTSGDLVAYCYAPVENYSAFGSYTGNGSSDGPFVYTGHRSRWILIKSTSTVGQWGLWDTARNTFNVTDTRLIANLSNAELTNPAVAIDVLSNGFKLKNSDSDSNQNGATYIYAAFAENPFKYARAR